MQLRSTLYFVLFCLLPGLGYQYVQDKLRPRGGLEGEAAALAGIAPNFLGGVSLTAGFILIAASAAAGRRRAPVLLAASLSLASLLGWEVLQRWMPGGTFDPADLLATLPGVLIAAAAAYPILQINRRNKRH
jgi:hypothetical protein